MRYVIQKRIALVLVCVGIVIASVTTISCLGGICKEGYSDPVASELYTVRRWRIVCGFGGGSRSELFVSDNHSLFQSERSFLKVKPGNYIQIESYQFLDPTTLSVQIVRDRKRFEVVVDLSNPELELNFDYGY